MSCMQPSQSIALLFRIGLTWQTRLSANARRTWTSQYGADPKLSIVLQVIRACATFTKTHTTNLAQHAARMSILEHGTSIHNCHHDPLAFLGSLKFDAL